MTTVHTREQLRTLGLVLLNTYCVQVDPSDDHVYRFWTARATDASCSTNRVFFGHGRTEGAALSDLVDRAREEVG